jgi:hypothetical protein
MCDAEGKIFAFFRRAVPSFTLYLLTMLGLPA